MEIVGCLPRSALFYIDSSTIVFTQVYDVTGGGYVKVWRV